MFKNTWDIARQTVAKEGFLALYKGKCHVELFGKLVLLTNFVM
jgi:hypothetical protein